MHPQEEGPVLNRKGAVPGQAEQTGHCWKAVKGS